MVTSIDSPGACQADAEAIRAVLHEALKFFDRPYGHHGFDERLYEALDALDRIDATLAASDIDDEPGPALDDLPLFEEAML